ncbi:ArnT family glycosyltransferase [Humisphaera borealis]|uniref:Glycosyltransferase family 39 protein n=1 Tax=Humisphaera borealis TaxID=2807512 RepID=A0A7M2WRU5_9BACT|nr:glycosyltransferase family 39 protein [Humisphaera borealis]QOV88109.1 glycosyltransferase family 39 protein [Humisphaera borealis]
MTDPRRFSRATLILIVAAFVVYLVGNADVPLWDRDEPRYAQCSRQMLESGDWVLPRYLGDLRLAKPPLIYWLQASSMTAFGVNEFAARLPSAIAMALTLTLLAVAVRKGLSAEHAFWSVLVMAASVMTVVSAKACLTDSVLLLFITIAQLCLYLIWRGRGTWPVFCILGLAIGLTLMTKGPVGLGIHAMTFVGYGLLTWSLRWKKKSAELEGRTEERTPSTTLDYARSTVATADALVVSKAPASRILLKVMTAIVLVVAVCLPWVILVEQRWAALPADVRAEAARGSERKRAADPDAPRSTGEHGYIWTVIEKEVIHRSKVGQEGHSGPPGYYLAAIWGIFLPWSLLLPATIVLAWKRRHLVHVRFALGAVLGPWLMFEIVQTKLPHYLLPCFVPLAILTADAIVQCLRHGVAALSDRAFRRGAVAWGIVFGLLGLTPWLAATWFTPQPWIILAIVSIAAIAYAAYVVRTFLAGQTQRALVAMGLGGLLMYGLLFRVFLPSCDYLQLAPKTADVLIANKATEPGKVLMLDYKEPSLAFYQGGTIREHPSNILTGKLLDLTKNVDWYVVTRDVWNASAPKSPAEADPRLSLDIVSTFRGLDVADGMRNVEVMVLKRKQPSQ